MVHTLVIERLHDEAFLASYCVGFERVRRYVMGETDGQPKDADWAAAISRRSGRHHPLAGAPHGGDAHHAQRLMVVAARRPRRAALLGGDPAGRVRSARSACPAAASVSAMARPAALREPPLAFRAPTMEALANPLGRADPGGAHRRLSAASGRALRFQRKKSTYPDIRLVYWAGGNPFHHHQDTNRLRARLAAARHHRRA